MCGPVADAALGLPELVPVSFDSATRATEIPARTAFPSSLPLQLAHPRPPRCVTDALIASHNHPDRNRVSAFVRLALCSPSRSSDPVRPEQTALGFLQLSLLYDQGIDARMESAAFSCAACCIVGRSFALSPKRHSPPASRARRYSSASFRCHAQSLCSV